MSDRNKPRHPAPDLGAETRALHEKIQEGYTLQRQLNATLNEIRMLLARLDKEYSEDAVRARLEPLLSEEAIQAQIGPVIGGIVDRLIEVADIAAEVMSEREDNFKNYIAKVLGAENKEDLVRLLARMVVLEVTEAADRIRRARQEETEVMRSLSELIPGLTETLSRPKRGRRQ